MEYYSSHINKLIEQLSHLPGIGAKSAQRLAFHIMNMPKDQVEQLTSSITGAREILQLMKKQASLMAFIMFFMVQSLQCLESGRMISN